MENIPKITHKTVLTEITGTRLVKISVYAPHIAAKAKAGQFVVVMAKAEGERIPLTVVDTNKEEVTLIFQELGFSTKLLGTLNEGDVLYAIVGPMGHATDIENHGNVILVAGGVGIAEIYPVAKAMKEKGNNVAVIIGAKTKEILILEKELQDIADELHITTDDGSCGVKGFTTDVLKDLLKKDTYNLVYAVGPIPMMKQVSLVTKEFKVKTLVSLNAIMLDATGMCGGCRVTIGNEIKFACVEGPEFDAHAVDWDELIKRNNIYTDKEKHICKLYDKEL